MKVQIFFIVSFFAIYTQAKLGIVGGKTVNITDHPYQVSLLLGGSHYCGGTIIGPRTVVTAAHCTDGYTSKYFSIRYNSSTVNTGGSVIQVKEVHQHPKYIENPPDYDVSVLILKSSIKDAVNRTAKLANNNLAVGTICNVTGWGVTSENKTTPSKLLQKVELPILNLNYCNSTYEGEVTNRFICAGYPKGGKDACQGDSGGPLVVNNTLYGIISYGYGCARPSYPGLYTSVLNLRNFIIASKSTQNCFNFSSLVYIMLIITLLNLILH